MSAIVIERVVACRSDVCSLWNVLTDTERFNRAVGQAKVEFRPLANGSAARFLGKTNLGGFDVEYEERPFEWQYLKSFHVQRAMRNGPAKELGFGLRFEPKNDGTTVKIELSIAPRLGFLSPFMRLQAQKTLTRMEEEVHRIDAALASGAPPPPLPRKGEIDEAAIERAAKALYETEPKEIVDELVRLVRDGSDIDAARMRPYQLADQWKKERRAVLTTMLRAVRFGLLELRWELVCPSCRVATESVPSLSQLKEHGTCQLCEVDFGLDVDEAVEATFAPTRAVRDVDFGPYCIGGPARVPHVVAQVIVPPKSKGVLATPDETGRYRLFLRGGMSAQVEIEKGAPSSIEVREESLGKGPLKVAPEGKILVENASEEERHAKLERSTWASQAATARDVTSLPAFRRDFSSDVLRPGASLKVSRVAIFFSDLTASTQLYSTIGDAAAFKLVQDHFDVVLAILERHHGSLVKTIGDAVMAVFASDEDGVIASAEILRAFQTFRKEHPDRARTHIKLGLFAGPCYVVTANGILDYFGQSVNIAARLQAQAESGELVIEEELADRVAKKGIVAAEWIRERYDAKLKGVTSPVRVAKISVGLPAFQPFSSAFSVRPCYPAPRVPSYPSLAPDAQRKFLRDLVRRVADSRHRDRKPVAVFDLDGTLMDNRPRSIAIFRELADAWSERHPEAASAIRACRPEDLAYAVTDSLMRFGIESGELLEEATRFWKERFFRDAYLVHDVAIEGAADFVRALYAEGANIVYLTGRDLPFMGVGSWQSLRELGFPIGVVGTELVCKPDAAIPDETYKRDVAPLLARVGDVLAAFDNEPGNCNVFLRGYPTSASVLLDTQHAEGAPPLDAGVVCIKDFRM